MKPQLQRHRGGDGNYGDCYRTCLAMVLDMDRDDVPHFCADVPPGTPTDDPRHLASVAAERAWLFEQGVSTVCTAYNADLSVRALAEQLDLHSKGVAAIVLCGLGNGMNHAVAVYNGVIYDPLGNIDQSRYGPCLDGMLWLLFLVKATNPLPEEATPAIVATQED